MGKNRTLTAGRVAPLIVLLGLLLAGGGRVFAQTPDEDPDAWFELRAELGESHASGGQPELGPQLIGNPTSAVTLMRIGLRYSFTTTGAFSEFQSFHHPFVRLSNTADAVHILDLSTEKQVAVMEPGMAFEVRYDAASSSYVVTGPDGTVGAYAGPIYFRPSSPDNLFRVESIRRLNANTAPLYRGAIEVARGSATAAGNVNVVNVLELESYVRGVVTNESPASFHVEALKAQAVAARGYAVSNLGRFVRQGLPFDLDDSTSSQVYRGVTSEHPKGDQAVAETRALVASYRGRIIQALYSSSMGGHTENNEWIFNSPSSQFPGTNVEPYLRGVYDGEGAAPDFGSETAVAEFWKNPQPQTFDECQRVRNRFARWQLRLTAANIKSRLTAGRFVLESGTTAGQVTGVEVVQRMAASGRIGIARISLTTGSVLVRGWENLRRVLGATAVSTTDCRGTTITANFVLNNPSVVEPFSNADGTFGGVTAYGGGWGHNVGLSQFGAHGRGLAGQSFIQILKGYYTGVDVGSYPIDIGREPSGGPPTLRQEFFAPTGRGTLEIRPEGLKGLRVHINGAYDISLTGEDLAGDVVRLDVTPYLQAGPNVIQYNPVGRDGSATVLVIVE
jgi:SpoIID/LytB domain protein